jgi:methylenetetrahydrofolate dehydrogenase (NADP+) / methenyltetrahydrofolate cyclohydrolase
VRKAKIISGKEVAEKKRKQLKNEVETLRIEKGVIPRLTVILVGNHPASQSYVNGKKKACAEVGIKSEVIEFDETISEAKLLTHIQHLNDDEAVHGILIQLPLPAHINTAKVIESVNPNKDVDGFHPINIGKMMIGQESFLSCTPFGIIELLKSKEIQLAGKHVVVVGRSNIVGKPVGQLFLNEDATVTYCHSRTANLKEITLQADILIVAVGKANYVTGDYIKDGAVVIDVGVNRLDNGKLCGDVAFVEAIEKASFITPVPGGVGPMTVTMLLHNTIQSAQKII